MNILILAYEHIGLDMGIPHQINGNPWIFQFNKARNILQINVINCSNKNNILHTRPRYYYTYYHQLSNYSVLKIYKLSKLLLLLIS